MASNRNRGPELPGQESPGTSDRSGRSRALGRFGMETTVQGRAQNELHNVQKQLVVAAMLSDVRLLSLRRNPGVMYGNLNSMRPALRNARDSNSMPQTPEEWLDRMRDADKSGLAGQPYTVKEGDVRRIQLWHPPQRKEVNPPFIRVVVADPEGMLRREMRLAATVLQPHDPDTVDRRMEPYKNSDEVFIPLARVPIGITSGREAKELVEAIDTKSITFTLGAVAIASDDSVA